MVRRNGEGLFSLHDEAVQKYLKNPPPDVDIMLFPLQWPEDGTTYEERDRSVYIKVLPKTSSTDSEGEDGGNIPQNARLTQGTRADFDAIEEAARGRSANERVQEAFEDLGKKGQDMDPERKLLFEGIVTRLAQDDSMSPLNMAMSLIGPGGRLPRGVAKEVEKVVGAAIKDHTGKVWKGPTHFDILADNKKIDLDKHIVDGFVTSTGRFISREEAMKLVKKIQQQLSTRGHAGVASKRPYLIAEDLD
jgi:hypothetical protein